MAFILVIIFVLLLSVFLIFVLYGGEFILSVKEYNVFKVAAFESGFKSISKIQNSFSIHFFVMMLMFVIFDLEVVMFLGILISGGEIYITFVFLFVFVLGGFYMEWWYGKLAWIV